ncbi:MAG: hypothetical protein AUJ20_11270 [Comamonadaceae bacterium CG1_02_60_18]|nr:MAG: hypothetical protein AUJ20_11270 [Comamonadaceae bacterium CG1_02_60_18]PIQ52901.1 MAG: hypothetical protein COW02_09045 [Comamonadaceae bacterium CG12_big_fil_rev_8_21_14_0_65_59_15]
MAAQAALIELLARVGAQGGAVLVTAAELAQWPAPAAAALKKQKLLTRASPAASAVCPGCANECVMPVHTLARADGTAASFIVCDKRDDTNRVTVAADQLLQWRCDVPALCQFVAAGLDVRQSTQLSSSDTLINIGMLRGDKRTQMLALRLQHELALTAGNSTIPLADLVTFVDDSFGVDAAVVRQMVDTAPPADPRHTPSTARREVRKLETETMYASWQKAYRALRKKNPGKSVVWYSQQLAKTPLAQGRNASTIKKHMLT